MKAIKQTWNRHRTKVAGGGLTAGVVLFCFANFAPKHAVSSLWRSQTTQNEKITDLQSRVTALETAVQFIAGHGITTALAKTNNPNLPPKLQ